VYSFLKFFLKIMLLWRDGVKKMNLWVRKVDDRFRKRAFLFILPHPKPPDIWFYILKA